MSALPTGTLTFLFTDMEGSTPLWERHEAQMRAAAARHDVLLDGIIAHQRGQRVRCEGDSLFAVFEEPGDAVAAALAMAQALLTEPWPIETPIRVRMGLHTGAAQLRAGDYYGPVVNRCARIRGLGHGGQILLSAKTAALVEEALPPGAALRPLGTHSLKGLSEPETVFQLCHPALPADFPPLQSPPGQPSHTALLRTVPSAVVSMDLAGTITMLNKAAEQLLGTTASEAMGQPYPAIFGPSLAGRIVPLFLRSYRAKEAGEARTFQATLPSGRRATLRANLGQLRDTHGRVIGSLLAVEEQEVQLAQLLPVGPTTDELRLRDLLRRYVGANVAAQLDRPSFVSIGGDRIVLSVLHADIRGYTTLAEQRAPESVMNMLLRCHGAAVLALQAEGATVDRYIGDAVTAFWNAPQLQPEHARLAIRGALAMQAATRDLEQGVRYGIGIHTGEAVVGNLGCEEYMHYTAIGDTVNIAARLQSQARGGEILGSASLVAQAGPGIRVRALPHLELKGRTQPLQAFSIEGIDG